MQPLSRPGASRLKDPIPWDDVRLIQAIAETQSLPAAAQQLGINHSTVFRRLRQIEAALGQALFERHRTGYVPTPAGEDMTALAQRVGEDITTVTRRLAGQAPILAGDIRMATSDSLLADLLAPMLGRFRRAHPAIRLDIVTGNVALNLSRRDADVAVRATDAPPDTLVGRRVARIAWALYGAAQGEVDPESSDWLAPGDNLATLKAARFARQHIAPERIAGRFDTVHGLSIGVEAGLGIAHLPCFVGDARPGLRRLSPPEPEFTADLWLLTHPDLRHTPRIRALLDMLADEVAERRGSIEGGD
jgi:DNA-binding transcriptional LysR family regulator